MNNPLQFAVYIISLLALAIILIKAASQAVSELELIAKYTKIKSFALASLLIARSTSLPEFVIAVSASLKQQAELALGMIMGSNIANISLTIGLAALIGGMVRSSDKLLKREVLYAFLIGTVPSILLLDGTLSRLDGMVLCSLYVVYVVKELVAKKAKPKENHSEKNITTSLKPRFIGGQTPGLNDIY